MAGEKDMLMDSKDYLDLIRGSFEERVFTLKSAIEIELKETIQILATFNDHIVYTINGDVMDAKYKIENNRIKIEPELMENLKYYDENKAKKTVSNFLNDFFDKDNNLSDEEKRNQFRVFTKLVESDINYNINEPLNTLKSLVEVTNNVWLEYYNTNEEEIKKSLFGEIQKLKKQVPSKLRTVSESKVNQSTVFLVENNVDILLKVVQSINVRVAVEDDDGDENREEVKKSVKESADKIISSLVEVKELLNTHNVVDVLTTINSMNDYFRTMNIISLFLCNQGAGK